jgi:hypothetical protein
MSGVRHVPELGWPKTEGASQVHRDSTGTHHHQANPDTADPDSCNCSIYRKYSEILLKAISWFKSSRLRSDTRHAMSAVSNVLLG